MSELFKELCYMSGDLGKLIERLTGRTSKKELFKRYKELSLKIADASGKTFNEENQFYLEVLDELQIIQGIIRLFIEQKTNIAELLTRMDDCFANVEKIFVLR